MNRATEITDMNTPEGLIEHLSTLPSENLRSIAARPVFLSASGGNVALVAAAEGILIVRGEA